MTANTIILEGGLGNRMRVAASARALALAEGIELRVVWAPQWGMRCRFDALFEPVEACGQQPFSLSDARGMERIVAARPRLANLYAPRIAQRLCYRRMILSPQVWELNRQGFDYAGWLHRGGCLMTAYRDFAPWTTGDLRALFSPKSEVARLIDERCRAFRDYTIGVHIRRTDHRQAIGQSPLHLFTDAIDAELDTHGDMGIYLATDDEATKYQLRQRYGSRIVTSDAEATRDSTAGIRDAVVEMFSLSRTRHIYGSAGSTFSPIAAALADVPITILQRDGKGVVDLMWERKA